ncbi:PREDICTED: uncharacterized protein LOC106817232 [Priapulus caudatus]|uniref:Uncharacterized protein LOC106817232 n=1 Tax=Priapulus caudatus TaxID=37621 RepID=A0ABM1EYW1_PRICU|nr:PREDICTED: uncharacterized protein LOC106817232 [Priapulus caudatus]
MQVAQRYFPQSLNILSLAENKLDDLNEISYLSGLKNLEQLSIAKNPCVIATCETHCFDYRPFVVNWCLNLKILDGSIIGQREGLKGEWLLSQGKGRHFVPGEHELLTEYLSSTCPVTSNHDEPAKEAKLKHILNKQREYQQQLSKKSLGAPSIQAVLRGDNPSSSLIDDPDVENATDVQKRTDKDISADIPPPPHSTSQVLRNTWTSFQQVFSQNPLLILPETSAGYSIQIGRSVEHTESSASLVLMSCDTDDRKAAMQDEKPRSSPHAAAVSPSKLTSYEAYESRPIRPLGKDIFRAATGLPSPTRPLTSSPQRPDFYVRKPRTPVRKHLSSQQKFGVGASDSDAGSLERSSEIRSRKAKKTGRQSMEGGRVRPFLLAYRQPYRAEKYSPGREDGQENKSRAPASASSSAKPATMKSVRSVAQKEAPARRRSSTLTPLGNRNGPAVDKSSERGVTRAGYTRTRSLSASRIPLTATQPRKGDDDDPRFVYRNPKPVSQPSNLGRRIASGGKLLSPQPKHCMQATEMPTTMSQSLDSATMFFEQKRYPVKHFKDGGLSPEAEMDLSQEEEIAAVRIQALWKGYQVRHLDERVRQIKEQLRSQRLEAHVEALGIELKRNRQMHEQDKRLRTLQMDAIKCLWKEVKELRNWKSDLQSQMSELVRPVDPSTQTSPVTPPGLSNNASADAKYEQLDKKNDAARKTVAGDAAASWICFVRGYGDSIDIKREEKMGRSR